MKGFVKVERIKKIEPDPMFMPHKVQVALVLTTDVTIAADLLRYLGGYIELRTGEDMEKP